MVTFMCVLSLVIVSPLPVCTLFSHLNTYEEQEEYLSHTQSLKSHIYPGVKHVLPQLDLWPLNLDKSMRHNESRILNRLASGSLGLQQRKLLGNETSCREDPEDI